MGRAETCVGDEKLTAFLELESQLMRTQRM